MAAAFRQAAGGDVDVTVDPLWGPLRSRPRPRSAPGLVHLGQSASPEATLPSATVRGKALAILGHTHFAVPHDMKASGYRR